MAKTPLIVINVPNVFASAACKLGGHQWGPWTMGETDLRMRRECGRCGAVEKADVPQPKAGG